MKRSYMVFVTLLALALVAFLPGAAFGVGVIGFAGVIMDAHNLYSDAQALTGTANSTNVIDHGAVRNIGDGEPMCLVICVDVALDNTTGNETYTAKLVTDDNAALSSATDVTPAYTLPAGSAAGTNFIIPIPPGVQVERYTGVTYTLGGTTPTGTVTAFLQPLNMVNRLGGPRVYPDAVTISS